MLGAVAGSAHPSVATAVAAMAPPIERVVAPGERYRAIYDALYLEYTRLVNVFGRAADSPLKRVRALRFISGP
jgi:ribulose kinase